MQLVNMTPDPIPYIDTNGQRHVLEPSGQLVRVMRISRGQSTVDTGIIDIWRRDRLEILGLPEERPRDTVFIVSREVAEAIHCSTYPLVRHDLLTPGLAPHDEPLRDENGQLIAVTRFKLVF